MGKAKKDRNRAVRKGVKTYVTVGTYQDLEREAERRGTTVAAIAREALLERYREEEEVPA